MSKRIHTYDILRYLRTLTLQKLLNLLLIYFSMWVSRIIRKPFVAGMPHTVSVEPTTRCNLSCPECPVGNHTLTRSGGDMSLELYRKIIRQSASFVTHVMLYFQGEPFLASAFFTMITYAKSLGIYVSSSTNGHFLTPQSIDKLLDSGIDRLIVSLDGASSENYIRYRVNGDFQKVVQGVEKLIQERDRRKQRYPLVILQFLLFSHNLQEISAVKSLGKKLGVDGISLKTAQFYHPGGKNNMVPDVAAYSRYDKNEDGTFTLRGSLKNHCNRIWTTLVVTWDGIVVPCCFDKQALHAMGNLGSADVKSIWYSQEFEHFRRTILTNRKEVEICRNCIEGIK